MDHRYRLPVDLGPPTCHVFREYKRLLTSVGEPTPAEGIEETLYLCREARSLACVGTWVVGFEDDDEVMWSRECYAVLGVDPSTTPRVGDWYDRLHPDDVIALRAARTKARREGSSYDIQYRTRRPGPPQWIHERASIAPGGRLMGIIQDVTERRVQESALALSEVKFRRLAESGIVGIGFSDVSGRLLGSNEALAEMLGYTASELTAASFRWADITPVEWRERDLAMASQLESNGLARPAEKELLHRDGTRVPALVGLAALDSQNVIAIVLDLSERKKAEASFRAAEQQLRHAQKLEAVGRLASGVAHDFNNMLTIVLSTAEVALGDLDPASPLHADVLEIRKAAIRAADLTRQLLLFSRQELVVPRVVELRAFLVNLDKMLGRLLGDDVELSIVANASSSNVEVDPGLLEQVIMNLSVNARDAMPSGGRLTIELGNVDGAARISIRDTGTGMDAATQARMFEPFFTTKDPGRGTGLGLSTALGIIEQAGGRIMVESEVGKGSCFTLSLPLVDATPSETVEEWTPSKLRGSETLLLVEDDDSVRAVLTTVLGRHGYRVIAAANPGEALLACERHTQPIDLLVTDVVMPQMTGFDLATRLWKVHPEMKVLCVSGYASQELQRQIIDSGFPFLQKPISVEALTTKLRQVLEGAAQSHDRITCAPPRDRLLAKSG